jgi:hypothetical protein
MKILTRLLGAACLAGALAGGSAVPAQAQSFSFGFGFGNGPSFHNHTPFYDYDWRWRHMPRFAPHYRVPRSGVSIDIGPVHLSVSHIQRCEARFHSYNRWSDSYMGFDGRHHRCRL